MFFFIIFYFIILRIFLSVKLCEVSKSLNTFKSFSKVKSERSNPKVKII